MRTLALVCLVALSACGILSPANSPERSIFDCRVDALRPAVDDALDAADLAREVGAKRASLSDALAQAKITVAQAKAIRAAYEACDDAPDAGANAGDAEPAQ